MTTDTLQKITGSTTTTTTIYVPDKPTVNPPAIPRIPFPPTSVVYGGRGGSTSFGSVSTGGGVPSPRGGSSGPSGGNGTNYVNVHDMPPGLNSQQIPAGTVIIYPPHDPSTGYVY